MADDINEKISALVDDELIGEEAARVLGELQRDLRAKLNWERYHLIGDALKHNLPDHSSYDLVSRVSQRLTTEPVLHDRALGIRRWGTWRPVTGFALAASVAAVAYLSLSWQTPLPQSELPAVTAGSASNVTTVATPASYSTVKGGGWDVDHASVASRLNAYLVNHDALSSMAAEIRRNVLPPVRIVSYEQAEASGVAAGR